MKHIGLFIALLLAASVGAAQTVTGYNATLSGNNNFTGINSFTGATVKPANALSALAIDVTKGLNTKTVSADQTFTFSGTPATAGTFFSLRVTNSDSSAHTLTIPSSHAVGIGTITSVVIPAGGKLLLAWEYDGSAYNLYGAPAITSGGGTSYLLVTPDNTVGKTLRVTGTGTAAWGALDLADTDAVTGLLPIANVAAIVEKIAVFNVDGGGSTITTGTVSGTARIPFPCTLTGYSITATGATGTTTVKFWVKANGTAIPTISDAINTNGVSLATGTAVASATLTDFTDTTYAALDMVRCAITAVDGTATDLTVTLYGTRL